VRGSLARFSWGGKGIGEAPGSGCQMECEAERHFRDGPPLFGRCWSVDYALFGGEVDRGSRPRQRPAVPLRQQATEAAIACSRWLPRSRIVGRGPLRDLSSPLRAEREAPLLPHSIF